MTHNQIRFYVFFHNPNPNALCVLNTPDLGQEELGKRGCPTKDLSTLDVDLKARHVTTEELSHAIGRQLEGNWINRQLALSRPAPWWDRTCDLGLIIGTFTYGIHRYRSMYSDNDLPFQKKIKRATIDDHGCSQAYQNFLCSTKAARNTFDKALSISQAKHAVGEGASLNLQKDKHVDQSSETKPLKVASSSIEVADTTASLDKAPQNKTKIEDGVVTISCLSKSIRQSLSERLCRLSEENVNDGVKNNVAMYENLPMPDSRCLDDRILKLINLIDEKPFENPADAKMTTSNALSKHEAIMQKLFSYLGVTKAEKESIPFINNPSTINHKRPCLLS